MLGASGNNRIHERFAGTKEYIHRARVGMQKVAYYACDIYATLGGTYLYYVYLNLKTF